MYCLQTSVANSEQMTQPLWPETSEGDLYRNLLLQVLSEHPGFLSRDYPSAAIVNNEFKDEASLKSFMAMHKLFLKDLLVKANAYYQKDTDVYVVVTVICQGKPDQNIDFTNAESFVL